MAYILSVRGFTPKIGKNSFIAPNATIVGEVSIGDNCTIWFNAVIRGDVNSIIIGDNCNIQDGAVVHCTYQKTKVYLGKNVSVAHNAIIHGCTIEDNVLIGMGAIIMDNVHIGAGSIIAAGAVVLAGTKVEAGSIWAGNPAKYLKPVGEKSSEIARIAQNYPMYAEWFKEIEK
ncbi:MAG: gamma carbonic anhydrase family protein [Thermonemataceae bacterium]|nr:gamma carbonic anhydrase family protein [Thermonemataceae bacterium]